MTNMILYKYRKKRNFSKTPEPSGEVGGGKKELVFVVQKHSARRLHYDLRLEAGGVLKSWAVPKGIARKATEKKLAMMVEDHPFEYRKFEGIIPKGNYGAGEVIIWDQGVYRAIKTRSKGESERAVLEGIRKGKISGIFYGEKLKGEYTLVKIKSTNNSWLLIKKSDEFANQKPFDEKSVKSGKTIEDLKKENLDNDNPHEVDYKLLEKIGAQKEKMPEYIAPMLAKISDKPFSRQDWIFEIKWDGYRTIARLEKGKVKLYSRNHKEFRHFDQIASQLKRIKVDAIFDGEIVALDERGKADFQKLQNYMRASAYATIVYFVFDILYLNGFDLRMLELKKRKEILKSILPKTNIIRFSEHVEKSGKEFFDLIKEQGIEGIIAKKFSGTYHWGKRSDDWLKIKNIQMQEVVVAGFTQPRGSRKHIGSIIVGVFEGNKFVFAGHVGIGAKEERLLSLKEIFEKEKSLTCPFEKIPKVNEKVTWVKPRIVIEVKFAEWTKEGLIRQGIFVGIRDDKKPKEVIREMEKVKYITSVKPKKETVVSDGIKQEISNRDKVFWPKEKYTKGDVIDYYKKISSIILPHTKDRPQSLRRFPNGISGMRFYQKNMTSVPDWIETVIVHSGGEERDIEYMFCQKEADLVYMANLGCIEIHPWLSNKKHLDHPDFLVIDLDPLDVSFDAVIAVARAVHEILEELTIESFVKTSGSKGMHIYIPTGGQYDYDQTLQLARVIAMLAHARIPNITSIERSPRKRKGKVYIDFLQNRKGQTIAAPYSLRPVPGALVSTPLHWSEVGHKLDPKKFNIKTIHTRLKKEGDIWKNIFKRKISFKKVIREIEKNSRFFNE